MVVPSSSKATTTMQPKDPPSNIQKLDLSLDPEKTEERENQTKEAIRRYNESFGALDLEKTYLPLFELLWYGQMPCNDVKGLTSETPDELSFIKKCYWKDKLVSCNAIFQKRPTDQGMCCSFNMEKAENIFQESMYKDAIVMRQREDEINGFEIGEHPRWFQENNEPRPEAGRSKGLTLILDGHTDRLTEATVSDNFLGFSVVIDGKDKYPFVEMSGLVARPGFETNIRVNAFHLEGLEEIRKYFPVERNCYFFDEFDLKIHKHYSQSNCQFECELEFATNCLSTCNGFDQRCDCKADDVFSKTYDDPKTANKSELSMCIPWFYPTIENGKKFKMCDPWKTEKFKKILKEQVPKDHCNHCLPDCETTRYDSSASYAELQKCDRTTIGSTNTLCDLVNRLLNPAPWVNIAQNEYRLANQSIPWYLETKSSTIMENAVIYPRFSNRRSRAKDINANTNAIFAEEMRKNPTYDAFEKDIGIVNVFFGDKTISKYVTANRMSAFDFLSQIGGSLGLVMGISIISLIELFYWVVCHMFANILKF